MLEDTDWQGGYRRPSGQTYGGRTASWIYGSSTEYSIMRARFAIAGTVTLTIEGMDSEGCTKTPIQILVNGAEIYNGPNNVVMLLEWSGSVIICCDALGRKRQPMPTANHLQAA